MFPYPSGTLHVGHLRNYTIADVIARYRKMKGDRVVQPMGWDVFGLPAENAAIANGVSPREWTDKNIAAMRTQIRAMNCDIDWDREIATNNPDYYRWTQWFFSRMVERGIAYRKKGVVNYDPVERTVLANEQVDDDGRGWRSGAKVERREMEQWYVATTRYAEEMIADIDASGMPPEVRRMQRSRIADLRDWCVSRQRFWGTPIPVVHCPRCGAVPVPDERLPVVFPEPEGDWKDYPRQIEAWKCGATCPKCGGAATRETDTMDTFVDSAWYFFRYLDPRNPDRPFDPEVAADWMPMAFYVGGREHATAHLVYARFFARFVRDLGMYAGSEPFARVVAQGMVTGKTYRDAETGEYLPASEFVSGCGKSQEAARVTWEKMSKSKFNGVSVAGAIAERGADVVRTYVAFKAPVEKDLMWNEGDIAGVRRFLNRVRGLTPCGSQDRDPGAARETARVWREYCRNMDALKFNVAIAACMKFSRDIAGMPESRDRDRAVFAVRHAIAPFAPGIA